MKYPDIKKAQKLNRYAVAVSIIVLLLVGMMRRVKLEAGIDFSFIPPINAAINSIVFILLLFAYYYIRKRKSELHRKLINLALLLSVIFLALYVVYHLTSHETLYCRMDWTRTVYFVFLVSHIILAAVVLPFVLFTYIRAYTSQFERHKRLARWVFPVWLYVAISGPVCYLMLSPCY